MEGLEKRGGRRKAEEMIRIIKTAGKNTGKYLVTEESGVTGEMSGGGVFIDSILLICRAY